MRFQARNPQRFENTVMVSMSAEEAEFVAAALDFTVRGIEESEIRAGRKTKVRQEQKLLRFHQGLTKCAEKARRGIVGKA